VLTDLLLAGGYFLGADLTNPQRDSLSWYQRFVVPLVTSRFFPSWTGAHGDTASVRWFGAERLADTWTRFRGDGSVGPRWGWKYGESLFVLPLLAQLFPGVRVVHLVRDGRDVCTSVNGLFQATGALQDPPGWDPPTLGAAARPGHGGRPSYREFCFAVTFLDPAAHAWEGIDLTDPTARVANRYLIQMKAWCTAVETARRYQAELGVDYCEVRYEQLCQHPRVAAGSLFDWLGDPVPAEVYSFVDEWVRADRVNQWRRVSMSPAQRVDFARALEYAAPILTALGYE
jgi:hypothetical protein